MREIPRIPNEQLLTIPEAAAQLGVPVSTLRRAVNAGHIPTHSVFNQRKRVRLSEVLSAIASRTEGGLRDGKAHQ